MCYGADNFSTQAFNLFLCTNPFNVKLDHNDVMVDLIILFVLKCNFLLGGDFYLSLFRDTL